MSRDTRHPPCCRISAGAVGDELLKLHRSYLKPIQSLHQAKLLKGAAHITGGGITDNTPRILPKGLGVRIRTDAWPNLPIFELLRKLGDIPIDDYRRTFNLGIGMIFVVGKRNSGEGCESAGQTRRDALPDRRGDRCAAARSTGGVRVRRLGILLSGRGSNFEAIARSIAEGRLNAEIAVVISNRPEARGLERARRDGTRRGVHPVERYGPRGVRSPGRRRIEAPRCRPGVPCRFHAPAQRLSSFASFRSAF